MTTVRRSIGLALVAVALAACGGPDAGAPDAGGPAADAGVADAAPPDAPPEEERDQVRSNLRGLVWKTAPLSSPYLTLVSVHVVEDSEGSVVGYAEVHSTSLMPACWVKLRLRLVDAAGATVTTLSGFADAPAHDVSTLPRDKVACIAPGGDGVVVATADDEAAVPLEGATRAVYQLDAAISNTFVASPRAPTVASAAAIDPDGDGRWALGGTLAASAGGIYGVVMSVYPVDEGGLIAGRVEARHGSMATGESWAYQTDSLAAPGEPYPRWLQFVTFYDAVP